MLSPDSALIASGSDDKTVMVWESATGCRVHTVRTHSRPVAAVCFSPDGAIIASGSEDKTVATFAISK